MTVSRAGVADTMTTEAGFARPSLDVAEITDEVTYELSPEDTRP